MKIEVIEPPCQQRLPEVGQFWRFEGLTTVYQRVTDSIGRKVLNHDALAYKDYFYSMVPSRGEYIHATSYHAHGIQLLQPVGGGTLKLEVVS